MDKFKVIIVEDVPLELKGTEGIIRNDIPEAEIVGTAENETAYWRLMKNAAVDLVLLDLGLGGSTTVGVEICRQTKQTYPAVKVLIFTGEILNEKLWVDMPEEWRTADARRRGRRDERQADGVQPAYSGEDSRPFQARCGCAAAPSGGFGGL